jgi:tetratricopeptide (TPR) repeat protein
MHPANKINQPRFFPPLGRYLRTFLFLQILLSISVVHAGKTLTIDNDRQFTYAMHLFSNGEYGAAITEFKRFIYFFPEDTRVSLAHYTMGQSFFSQKQYRNAIGSFKTCAATKASSPVAIKSVFMISQCHLQLHEPGPAIIGLRNLAAGTKDIDTLDKTNYHLGWIYLDRADWREAERNFNKISAENAHRYSLTQLTTAISQHRSIPRKNPALAGWLSILPGSGQLYCGRYHDALVAFLINGGLIWATCESFDRDLDALGTILGITELGFYSGNIYSAVNSAHKYNRSKARTFIENIRENTRVTLSAMPGEKGVVFSVRYRF